MEKSISSQENIAGNFLLYFMVCAGKKLSFFPSSAACGGSFPPGGSLCPGVPFFIPPCLGDGDRRQSDEGFAQRVMKEIAKSFSDKLNLPLWEGSLLDRNQTGRDSPQRCFFSLPCWVKCCFRYCPGASPITCLKALENTTASL